MTNNYNSDEKHTTTYEAPKATVLQFTVDVNLMATSGGGPQSSGYDGHAPTIWNGAKDADDNDWN